MQPSPVYMEDRIPDPGTGLALMTAYAYTEIATGTTGGIYIKHVEINGLARSSDSSRENWPHGSGLEV